MKVPQRAIEARRAPLIAVFDKVTDA